MANHEPLHERSSKGAGWIRGRLRNNQERDTCSGGLGGGVKGVQDWAWLACGAVAAAVLQLLPPFATADNASNSGMYLGAQGRFYSATVWTGEHAFVVGGENLTGVVLAEVIKFDPASGANGTVIGNLSRNESRHSHSAIWDGNHVYVFGGYFDGVAHTEVLRYDPATNETATVANFSTTRQFTSAIWNGTYAFVFGGVEILGENQRTYRREVVRFDPATNELTVVVNNSTHGDLANHIHAGSAAVWDGSHVYLLGGKNCDPDDLGGNVPCDEIVRFRPSDNNVTVLGAKLPKPLSLPAAAWDGLAVYTFGNETDTDQIVRYRPATDAVTVMNATLPGARGAPNAFWNGTRAFVLTGRSDGAMVEEIVGYVLVPGKPNNLAANSEAGLPVEIRLAWDPPDNNTYTDSIEQYKVYRWVPGDAPALVATLGNVLAYTDPDVVLATNYCYVVTAVNVRGEGPPSIQACAQAL